MTTTTTEGPREGLAFVDGEIIDLADATVPLVDRGYLLGDGVFDTLRTSSGRIFQRDAHEARMKDALKVLGFDADAMDGVREALDALAKAGRDQISDELYLRVQVTTGDMANLEGSRELGARITGMAKPFKPYPMRYLNLGVHLVLSRQIKHSQDPLSRIKSLSFMPSVAARRLALNQIAHDGIFSNEHGRLIEASTSNLFARRGDTVYAPGPEEGAVPGITRKLVLEWLEEADFEVKTQLQPSDFRRADEAWITNTVGGVVPVNRYNEKYIGDGQKGDVTRRLQHTLNVMIQEGAP
ncbi:MAG: aminotransferase class IV [Thermoplasmatota archaeon]